jgi:hypothetical protein
MTDSEAHHLPRSQRNGIFTTLLDRGVSPAGFHLEDSVIGEHKAVRLVQTATTYHFAITILRCMRPPSCYWQSPGHSIEPGTQWG